VLIVACFGSGLTGQAGAARLLFAMGRDRVLPLRMFGYVDARSGSPARNILFVGVLAFAGTMLLGYEQAAELLNFGAFLAFMGVNLAALRKLYLEPPPGSERRRRIGAVIPILGFLFCLGIWVSLPAAAKIGGGLWLAAGVIYGAIRTRGFRVQPVAVDFSEA
jgi:putrescine importer